MANIDEFGKTAIQRFDHLLSPTPSATLALTTALDEVQGGTYQHAIERLRRLATQQSAGAYREAKHQLAQWTFGGTFAPTRAKANLTQHSGICHADIDHLPSLDTTRRRLMDDPHVVYCFTSPSGDGLKYGVRVAAVQDDAAYKHAWQYLADTHAALYQVTWDPSGKDICRLCFVSWDPDCYRNLDAHVCAIPPLPPPVMVTPPPRPSEPVSRERREQYGQWGIANAVKIIAESTEGNLHEARCRAAYLLGGYVGGGLLTYDEAFEALRAAVEGHTQHLAASLKTIAACLKDGEAKPITLEALETDWQQWKAAHPLVSEPHVLPDHIKNHPDPNVRRYWERVYRRTNDLKRALAAQGAPL